MTSEMNLLNIYEAVKENRVIFKDSQYKVKGRSRLLHFGQMTVRIKLVGWLVG